MTAEEIEAIVGGYHGDAFRILGPHSVRKRGAQARWEVRAFLPQAESAEVVAAGERARDGEAAPAGLLLRRRWPARRRPTASARACGTAVKIELDDPYRFGPQLSDSDLYLHTEGTLLRGLPHARRAPRGGRGRPRRALRRVGAECRKRHGHRRIQRVGHPPPSHAAAQRRRLGDLHSRTRRRHLLQVQRPLALRRLPAAQGRSVRVLLRDAAEIRIGGLGYRQVPMEGRRVDGGAPEDRLAEGARSRSTKCTWNRGCAARTASRSPTASWPSSWWST